MSGIIWKLTIGDVFNNLRASLRNFYASLLLFYNWFKIPNPKLKNIITHSIYQISYVFSNFDAAINNSLAL